MELFKDYLDEAESHEDVDDMEKKYPTFFETCGKFFDSLDNEVMSDDTHKLLNALIDSIIDAILSCGDEEFDEKTEKQFLSIVKMLGLDTDEDVDEGLAVKSRKTNAGRKKSGASRMTGANKIKYLKSLKKSRKTYKKSPSLKRKAKKKGIKYKKSARGKQVKKKYKTLNKGK